MALRLLGLACWALALILAPLPAQEQVNARLRALRDFDTWVAAWQRGEIDLAEDKRRVMGRMTPAQRREAPLSARAEFERILEAVQTLDGREAALRVVRLHALALEAVGQRPGLYPTLVVTLTERSLREFQSMEAHEALRALAAGEVVEGAPKDRPVALRAAALRLLGTLGRAVFRGTLEQALLEADARLRIAAAQGLARMGRAGSVEPLARALASESQDAVLRELVPALRQVLQRDARAVNTKAMRAAVLAAVEALGRGAWQTDLALVELLEVYRAAEAVPALIAVLERLDAASPDDHRRGRTSNILRLRTDAVLRSLTGASAANGAAVEWRRFWEQAKDGFVLAKAPEVRSTGTVAGGFFGIPVEGSRVVFVIDVSGSMVAPYTPVAPNPQTTGSPGSRLDAVRAQLRQAVQGLKPESTFVVIVFASGVQRFHTEPLAATPQNKEHLFEYLGRLGANGGTNLWGGLKEALLIATGGRTDVPRTGGGKAWEPDEIFLLSDGAPSAGELTDTTAILAAATDLNATLRARVHTVYVGGGEARRAPDAAAGFMRELAARSGGRFVQP